KNKPAYRTARGGGLHRPGTGAPGSAAAAPDREALGAVLVAVQRLHGVATEARGLVAGQGLELVADPQRVAVVERDAFLHRDLDLAALFAARGRAGDDLHRLGAGGHVDPGAAGCGEQAGGGDHQAHGGTSFGISLWGPGRRALVG